MIRLIRNLTSRVIRHRVMAQSAQLAFYLLLSFFPCLIILTRFAVHDAVRGTLFGILDTLLPSAAADLVNENLTALDSYSLVPTGVIILLYAASRGISTLIYASVSAYEATETRSFLFRFLLRFLLLPMILLLGVSAVVCILILNRLFANSTILYPIWQVLRYPVALLIGSGVFAVLYRCLPNIRTPFYRHLPGAVFSTVVGIAASSVFSVFADVNNTYSAYYGSMSGVILLLLWLYLCSMVIIFGMEFNAAIFQKGGEPIEHNEPDADD